MAEPIAKKMLKAAKVPRSKVMSLY